MYRMQNFDEFSIKNFDCFFPFNIGFLLTSDIDVATWRPFFWCINWAAFEKKKKKVLSSHRSFPITVHSFLTSYDVYYLYLSFV